MRRERSTNLDLRRAGLTEIPSEVFELAWLESLNLSGNEIRVIPDRLAKELPGLVALDVSRNPIEWVPDVKGIALDWRSYLRCRSHVAPEHITGLHVDAITPEWYSLKVALPNLETVLNYSMPVELPHWIAGCHRLNDLSWNCETITDLPDWLSELQALEYLILQNPSFTKIPNVVFRLARLALLQLDMVNGRPGRITEIPPEILQLRNLIYVSVDGQPITTPPPEVVNQGVEAIKEFWRQRQESGNDYLCEAKLLILGEAGAGKTSLANKIKYPKYELKDQKSTEGIEVHLWSFPTQMRARDQDKILPRDFRVNIWDFGGQEIYHATHQFFLTKRSVYVLVADDRKEDTDFDYWLQVVELLSDGSPLMIVQNNKQGRARDLNLSSLRARFPNLLGAYSVDLSNNRGLEQLVDEIRRQLAGLPHIGTALPRTWTQVRLTFETDPRNYISLDEYFRICQESGFHRDADKLQLSGYLHDLGICLHFQNDPVLRNTVILKPKWGTDAVYRVLDDKSVIARRGRFSEDDLTRIWSEGQYASMRHELIRLMINFELCYQLSERGPYIAPQLLSPEQPQYSWSEKGTLALRYEYDFMPKGIITRATVGLNRLIADELVWKTGVVLERNRTRAELIEDHGRRRITLRVSGPDTRGLLAIVDEQMERIHESFPRLKYDKYLPCGCDDCGGKSDAYLYPLAQLRRFAEKQRGIQCGNSGDLRDAAELIRDIFPDVEFNWEQRMENAAGPREVFVSYSWVKESSALVDRIQEGLGRHDIQVIRDKNEMKYKDSIREFMKRMGRGKAIVIVLSKAYLESHNCMFELTEIAERGDIGKRVFPILMPDAKIHDALTRIGYLEYWETKIRQLTDAMKRVSLENQHGIREELDLYSRIRATMARIVDLLSDMNLLSLEQVESGSFQILVEALEKR